MIVIASRVYRALAGFVLSLALALLFAPSLSGIARAQGKLEGRYEVVLAGLTIGKGGWTVDVTEETYVIGMTGEAAGWLKTFGGGGGGTAVTQGRMTGGAPVSSSYVTSINYGKKNETIRIALNSGAIKSSTIEPEPPVNPERVPLTDAHRRGVTDPMTGALLRVSGTGDLTGPDACRNVSPIFDGRTRYDLKFEYKRTENVQTQKGYRGPAVVCAMYFVPVAGFVPDRPSIKHLSAERKMELWFVPIAGTRIVAPYRISIPTPFGEGVVQATEFVTTPTPKVPKTN